MFHARETKERHIESCYKLYIQIQSFIVYRFKFQVHLQYNSVHRLPICQGYWLTMLLFVPRHHPSHAIKRDVVSKVLQFAIEFALNSKVSVSVSDNKSDDGKDQKEKVFKKWRDLRIYLKRHLNRAHALTARLTDPDLVEHERDEADKGGPVDDDEDTFDHTEHSDPIVKASCCDSFSHS